MFKRFQVYSIVTTLSVGSLFADGSNDLATQASFEQVNYHEANKQAPLAAASTTAKNNSPKSSKITTQETLTIHPCPNSVRISGDFLYFLPTLDDTYFVIESSSTTVAPHGKIRDNDLEFSPGFRVGAEYAFCETSREIQAFYTWLAPSERHTVSGDHLWATVGGAGLVSAFENYSGSATSKLDLLYQRLDTNYSQHVIDAHGINVYVQPGLEWAYLRLNSKYSYESSSTLGQLEDKSKILGVGPQIGIALDYSAYQKTFNTGRTHTFTFDGVFSASIIMGQAQGSTQQSIDTGSIVTNTIKEEKSWRTVPAWHARIGFNYSIYGEDVGFALGAGYEFDSYMRGRSELVFPDNVANGVAFSEYDDFDIQGFYLSAAFSF